MVNGGFRLDLLLTTAQLARATYYYQLKQLAKEDKDKALKADIQAIFEEHKGNYGYRRVYLELRNRGYVGEAVETEDRLTISMPRELFTNANIETLQQSVTVRAPLLKMLFLANFYYF